MPRGVDHHGLARNDKGLGLPNLIHVDSVGWTWIDAPPPDDPGPRS